MTDNQRVIVIGDSHSDYSGIRKLNTLYGNSIFLHVGDFGVGFSNRDEEIVSQLGDLLDKNGNKLLIERGNHDSPQWFDNREIGPIKFLKDNQVIRIGSKDILFIGGAISIDRTVRKEGIDYWKDEAAIIDFQKVNEYNNVDVVISHTAPLCAPPFGLNNRNVLEWCARDKTLEQDLLKERQEFSELKDKLQEKFNIQRWLQLKQIYKNVFAGTVSSCPSKSKKPSGVQKNPSFLFKLRHLKSYGTSGSCISWFFAAFKSESIMFPQFLHEYSFPFRFDFRTFPQSLHR